MEKLLTTALAVLVGCSGKLEDPAAPEYEGDETGECSDGADNDRDGLFDCEDDGCSGSPDCSAESEADSGESSSDTGEPPSDTGESHEAACLPQPSQVASKCRSRAHPAKRTSSLTFLGGALLSVISTKTDWTT